MAAEKKSTGGGERQVPASTAAASGRGVEEVSGPRSTKTSAATCRDRRPDARFALGGSREKLTRAPGPTPSRARALPSRTKTSTRPELSITAPSARHRPLPVTPHEPDDPAARPAGRRRRRPGSARPGTFVSRFPNRSTSSTSPSTRSCIRRGRRRGRRTARPSGGPRADRGVPRGAVGGDGGKDVAAMERPADVRPPVVARLGREPPLAPRGCRSRNQRSPLSGPTK